MALTDNQCKNAISADGKRVTKFFDGSGLFLQVHATGRKYWRFQYYRPSDKKKDILALGIYPDVSLKAARQKQIEAKQLLADGIDPKQFAKEQGARKLQANSNTFQELTNQWYEIWRGKVSEAHAKRGYRQLEIYAFPTLGYLPIDSIMPMQVLDLVLKIEKDGKGETAHKVLDKIHQVFKHALKLRLCLFNPASNLSEELKTVTSTPYPHFTDPNKLGQLLRDLSAWTGYPQTRALLQLSPLVFTRPSEVRLMKWSEIDFTAGTWTKNADDMKNDIAHIIPLSRQAIAIIESLKPVTGHYDYVFWNKSKGQPLSEGASRKALHSLGYKGEFTPHGWRHVASTLLNEQGYNGDWVERQLSHKDQNVIRVSYNHASYLNDRIKMMQEWADYLDTLKGQVNID